MSVTRTPPNQPAPSEAPVRAKPLAQRHLWEITPVRDACILLVVLTALYLAYSIRSITVPILLGLALAYVFNPLVHWMQTRWRWPRWATTLGVIALCGLTVAAMLLWLAPKLARQIGSVITDLSQFLRDHWPRLAPYWQSFTDRAAELQGASREDQLEALKPLLDELSRVDFATITGYLMQTLGLGMGVVGSAISIVTFLVLATVITGFCFFFFSWKFPAITDWLKPLIPRPHREHTLHVLSMMDRCVAAFIRGRLIQSAVMAVILSIGWWIAGVPYWLLLGVGCGLLNLIPFAAGLGYLLAIALTLMHALAPGAAPDPAAAQATAEAAGQGFPWGAVIWPTIVFAIAQTLDSWVIEPLVQGSATGLDPLTVLLAVIVGGALAGLFGMLLAIPAAACLKILLQEVVLPQLRSYAEAT